jgi:CHAD domain-containing protein
MQVTENVAVASSAVTLRAPEDFELPDLAGLGGDLLVRPLEERPITTVLWDTADLRLARWDCSLSHREGEGWTVDLPGEPGGDGARRIHRFAGEGDAVPGGVLDLVAAFARTAPLTPRHRLHSRRRAVGLLDTEGRLLVEVDEHVHDGDGAFELEVAAVLGGPGGLLPAVVDRLEDAGAIRLDAGATLVGALGDAGPPEIIVDDAGRHSTAAAVIRRAIAASTVRLIRHDAAVRLGADPEGVHQARDATRRLRSDLRTFRSLVVPQWGEALREELRWFGGVLGEVRDADVLIAGLLTRVGRLPDDDRIAGDGVVEELRGRLLRSREHLLDQMRSERYLRLLESLVDASYSPALLPEAERPAREVLPGLVARPWSRLRRDARRLRRHGAHDEELHALRIRAKRTRYAAEAGAPVLGRRAARFARAVADLQDVLGEHHDAVVAAAWLRDHAGQGVPAMQAFAAGQLWGIENDAAAQARSRWARAWKQARRPKLRRWM